MVDVVVVGAVVVGAGVVAGAVGEAEVVGAVGEGVVVHSLQAFPRGGVVVVVVDVDVAPLERKSAPRWVEDVVGCGWAAA